MLTQVSQRPHPFCKLKRGWGTPVPKCQVLPYFRCGFDFGDAASKQSFQRFCKLGLDIDVLENGEIGAVFLGIESAVLAGHDHDRDVRSFGLGLERGDEFGAAHPGHLHVRDNDVGMNPLRDGQRFFAVGCRFHAVPPLLEKAAYGVPDQHGIVNNQGDKRSLAFCGQNNPRATLTNCYGGNKGKGRRATLPLSRQVPVAPASRRLSRGHPALAGTNKATDEKIWKRNYDSLGSLVSSMIMSLNSLDSKISPHSLHSTNSESSSRATI